MYKINNYQTKLLNLLIDDQKKTSKVYRPTPYWSYKTKKASSWILKNGFKDFRGLNSPVGTSYSDNLILDKRNELGLGLKSKVLKFIFSLPVISYFYNKQVDLTKGYIDMFLDQCENYYVNDPRIKELIEKYEIENSTEFSSVRNFTFNEKLYSCKYLDLLDILDRVHQQIDMKKVNTYFEIGGGFGANIHLILQNFKNIKKIIYLDVSPNLFIATEYLRKFYGDTVKDYIQFREKKIEFENNENLEVICIPPWKIEDLNVKIDHFHNTSSFQEMSEEVIINYYKFIKLISTNKTTCSLGFYTTDNNKVVNKNNILSIFGGNFKEIELMSFADSLKRKFYLNCKN